MGVEKQGFFEDIGQDGKILADNPVYGPIATEGRSHGS